MYTQWAPDAVNLLYGIYVQFEAAEGVGPLTNGTYATLSIPLLGVVYPVTIDAALIVASATFLIQIDTLRVSSANNGMWRVKFDALRFYVNGVLQHSEGITTLDNYFYFAPAGIPLFGIPERWGASGAINPTPTIGAIESSTTVGSSHAKGHAKIEAVHRFRETAMGAWQTLPVLLDLPAVPDVTCDCSTPAFPTLTATTTGDVVTEGFQEITIETTMDTAECDECTNGTASPPFQFNLFTTTLNFQGNSSYVYAIPNNPARVKRFNPNGYGSLVYRGGMPQTMAVGTASCGIDIGAWGDQGPVTASLPVEVHPSQSEILQRVGNTAAEMEDTFGYQVYAFGGKSAFVYETSHVEAVSTGTPGACPMPEPEQPPGEMIPCFAEPESACYKTVGSQFDGVVEDELDNPDLFPYLLHADPLARYINYWASRHWSYVYFFPRNTIDTNSDGFPDMQDVWEVFEDRIPIEYWLTEGAQFQWHPSLPGDENTLRRSTLISAPLFKSAHQNFMLFSVWGAQTSWWGDETFRVDNSDPLTFKTLDSTDAVYMWNPYNCTASYGATKITLTPTGGHTTLGLTLDLASYAFSPFMYAQIAKQITVGWDLTNIVSVTVSLKSITGTSVVLATTPGTYDRPYKADNKYAGSWKQDEGHLYFEDEGGDLQLDGISAATMSDPLRIHAFQLLAGRGAYQLVFDIEVASSAAACDIDYPTFRVSPDAGHVFHENRSNSAVIWETGPGVRFGNAAHYYDGNMQNIPLILPPGVSPIGWKPSALDWIAYRNVFLKSEEPQYDLAASISDFFTDEELEGFETNHPYGADYFSIAFLVPETGRNWPSVAIVNGASCPPVCVFPSRARDTDGQPTGSWVQETWSYADDRQFYVAPNIVHLSHPDTHDVWTVPFGTTYAGWQVSYHQHPVNNNEEYFTVRQRGRKIGYIRPWHGFFCVHRGAAVGREPAVEHITESYSWDARIEYDEELLRDSLKVRRSVGQPRDGYETDVEVADGDYASFPCIVHLPWDRLICGYTSNEPV